MLDFDAVVDLMKTYGYSTTTSHPYVYHYGDTIGICYLYYDDEYGSLERIKTFKDLESFEEFLKQLEWVRKNGLNYHVRMILDNYESREPKTMFLRNEKLMVEGEMFEIENFDFREKQRESMDDVSKVIYEAGDLLLVYDEMKGRQLQYLTNIIKLKNSLRQKYYDLQKEVDEYNHHKVEREIKLLPEIADSGINETMEIALKDKYNMYIAERPPYEEACEFLREVWELCKSLEMNLKYYDAQKEENDIHNEFKIVNQKMDLMTKLNDEGRPLFGIDLVNHFRKINKVCMSESTSISDEWIHEQIENIERKYSVFDNLDIINTSDYLREAIQNSNYADLAIKYAKGSGEEAAKISRTPLNEVAASLSIQYNNSLTPTEQGILVIYNNPHFRKLCDAILRVENFESIPVKKLISIVSKIKGYSKMKSIVYDGVKKRIMDPLNDSLKKTIFSQFDFTTYESFITSIINSLIQLKNINTKMVLSGDINMYIKVDTVDEVKNVRFLTVTNALTDLLGKTKGTESMIGIVLLKAKTPVLYSPYYLDIGDVYTKGASLQMQIKEMIDFELLIDCSDIIVNIDPKHTNVVRYYSIPKTVEDVSVVDDIKMSYKTTFCKYAFTSKVLGELPVTPPVALEQPESKEKVEQHVAENAVTSEVKQDVPVVENKKAVPAAPATVSQIVPAVKEEVKVEPPKTQQAPVQQPVKPVPTTTTVKPVQQVSKQPNATTQVPSKPVVPSEGVKTSDNNQIKSPQPVNKQVQPIKPNTQQVQVKTVSAGQPAKPQVVSTTKVGDGIKVEATKVATPVVKKVENPANDGKVHGPQLISKPEENKVTDSKVTTEVKPVNKEAINKPVSNADKDKLVASPLPVPKIANPNKKQVVVQKIGQPLKTNNVENKE